MRSLPQVTIRPLDGSMSMWAMLCFPSWNVANAVRLQHTHRHTDKQTHTDTHRHTHTQLLIRFALSTLKIWVKCDQQHQNLREAFNSLFFFDGIKAGVTHPHRKLKAHDWVCGAFRTTFSTNSLATLPAVVLHKEKNKQYISMTDGLRDSKLGRTLARLAYLSEAQGLSVPHLLDVPKERLLTLLTGVAV